VRGEDGKVHHHFVIPFAEVPEAIVLFVAPVQTPIQVL
jgi:hypothetical protein